MDCFVYFGVVRYVDFNFDKNLLIFKTFILKNYFKLE